VDDAGPTRPVPARAVDDLIAFRPYVDYSRHMDMSTTIRALSALAQESRLAAFRLLVRAGEEGLPAGEIARALAIPHNTLSTHLTALAQGGIVRSRRDGRSIIYSVDFAGTRALLAFLLEDCCRGAPEICSPALDSVLAGCCPTDSEGDPDHETTAR
jgi:ArsR family transcriptional regulator